MAHSRTSALISLGLLVAFSVVIPLSGDPPKQQAIGQITPTSSMNVPRAGHTATLLRDGTVLIAGGMLRNGDFSSTAEIFDPKTNRFTPTRNMLLGRVGAASALLPSGKVLIAGGWHETDDAEIYDPATRLFTASAKMSERRARPTATVLRDGTVLITGGERDPSTMEATNTAEVYDEQVHTSRLNARWTFHAHGHALAGWAPAGRGRQYRKAAGNQYSGDLRSWKESFLFSRQHDRTTL
jgi:Galactose oxidase, central domain